MAVIFVSGTPGTGKSTLCDAVAKEVGPQCTVMHLSDVVREERLYDEWDDELNCSIFSDELVENRVLREINSLIPGNCLLIDFHSVGYLSRPEGIKVAVLQVDNQVLYRRLKERGYDENKVKHNVECEIFMESFLEACEVVGESSVVALPNNTSEDFVSAKDALKRMLLA